MAHKYRISPYIDFNSGQVILDPMAMAEQMPDPMDVDDKIASFQCRIDVWQLGVAVEMLKLIEENEQPAVWSHAATRSWLP